jgi:preprotein translocase subunit SecD
VFKRVGKPVGFVVVIFIAALACFTYFGISYTSGDKRTVVVPGVQDIRLGIDINGGVDVTFTPAAGAEKTTANMKKAKDMIATRLDNLNITDRELYVDSKNNIIVRIPWQSGDTTHDPETVIKELGSMAQLVFKSDEYNSGADIVTGSDVKSASVGTSSNSSTEYVVNFQLNSTGIAKFATATKALYEAYQKDSTKGYLDIYMDNKRIEHAQVFAEITNGQGQISGGFTAASAQALADKINAGSLPFSLTTNNYSSISPTLGKLALRVMVWAGIVAFILICLFMMIYYRLPGFFACIALVGHLAGTILAISWPQFTLTLPGIAGIILSIGMGVDCNIITFERIREELRIGRTVDGAIDAGFEHSFSAIFDGNITVLIVGIILWAMGSATVKSFGYTLVWGVVFNFIMGLLASRLMLKSASRFPAFRNRGLYMSRRGITE